MLRAMDSQKLRDKKFLIALLGTLTKDATGELTISKSNSDLLMSFMNDKETPESLKQFYEDIDDLEEDDIEKPKQQRAKVFSLPWKSSKGLLNFEDIGMILLSWVISIGSPFLTYFFIDPQYVLLVGIVAGIIGLCIWLAKYVPAKFERYKLTDKLLLLKTGIFFSFTDRIELQYVTAINIDQDFVERIFNRGTLVVTIQDKSSDKKTRKVQLVSIKRPDKMAEFLNKLMRISKGETGYTEGDFAL